jgi:Subtilase family
MSPNQVIPRDNGALNPIAERVLKAKSLTYDVGTDGIVIAVKAELLVHAPTFASSGPLLEELKKVAVRKGTLAGIKSPGPKGTRTPPDPDCKPKTGGLFGEIEIWRLKGGTRDSIDESRRLRALIKGASVKSPSSDGLSLPAVSPNHVAILSPKAGGCPAAPPQPAHERDEQFIEPRMDGQGSKVTILDSGYIYVTPPHADLDARVTVVDGWCLDTTRNPPSWRPDRPDGLYTDPAGQLDGISGHGTFIAGLIAHIAPQARLELVGLRNQEVELPILNQPGQLGLFETEVAIAYAMLRRSDTDVIQCGFAFPTLDDYPSLPFAAVMDELRSPTAPRQGHVAVVAPAGNEQSYRPYWPAALPDVIGVASTNRRGNARAWFSNWGRWCDCCARGEYVYSTFVYWDGPVEGEPLTDIEHFRGWARWDGTSFAAPKVSAEIGRLVAENAGLAPTEAWNRLLSSAGEFVTDYTLSPYDGVGLPRIP